MAIIATSFKFLDYKLNLEGREAVFRYAIAFGGGKEDMEFEETLVLPAGAIREVPAELPARVLRNLQVAIGLSYFKLYCPSEVELLNPLTKAEADFWTTVYRKGLGEFFYRNNLDLNRSPRFPAGLKPEVRAVTVPTTDRALVGIGGGKDSIVALELLKESGLELAGWHLETQKPSTVVDEVTQILPEPTLKVQRHLDEKIFEDHPDSFNGHIPISVIYACVGQLIALLYDYRYVVMANEHSSNFGNVEYQGEEINHQWSKSAEFESMWQELSRTAITPDITYFSLLRPFYELRIAAMFAKFPKYFGHFSSCNRNFRVHKDRHNAKWCGECPKCAFMFAMMAAHLSRDHVIRIFEKNLFEEEALVPTYRDLLGLGDLKPWDCIGTFDETQAAFWLARENFSDSVALKEFFPKLTDAEEKGVRVMKTESAATVPTRFKFLGMKNVLILGHGKEGQVTERYLNKSYPDLAIGIADQSEDANVAAHRPAGVNAEAHRTRDGDDYLDRQLDYDITIRTPGIPKEKMTGHYTTATNIFFSQVGNSIIGVTGTKGKSTTASLIHHILIKSGRRARLLGNIGTPMLEALLSPIADDELFVLELSSFQLDDIDFSPHIAVALNLFPEHLDYHGSLEEYFAAKHNIVRWQGREDYFIYDGDDRRLKVWATDVPAKAVKFIGSLPFEVKLVSLLGDHNLVNVRAAVTVAQMLEIPDAKITRAVSTFKSLPHRLEKIGEFNGITFYDDAIATTPEATIAALNALPNTKTIFLGGLDRGYDFTKLRKVLEMSVVENVALFPDTGRQILADDSRFNVLETSDMKEAVKFAYDNTPKESICLLSTASPSYSIWKNFEEQGNEFKKFIKQH